MTEWVRDLANIRAAGFNTIKIWAGWRWNNPAEGEFDFTDLQRLMDLAAENDLRVMINLILDGAPAWLFRKHPDCRMVTADGRTLGPVTTGYRQTGGVPAHCFHHTEAVGHAMEFVRATGEAFASHPALAIWDLWNEPELTVGLLRKPAIADLVCHCPNSQRAFTGWLEKQYGSLDRLNQAWARTYQNWEELEMPVQPHTYRDFIDWRMFMAWTVKQELARRAQTIREVDNRHPVMSHTVPPPIFNVISSGSDDWLLAEEGDLHGNSVGSDPFAADLLRSAAAGKDVINAEIHALPGGTFHRPKPIGLREMKKHILVPLAHGIQGFVFWQYRPERLGAESPAWGLTELDGSPSPWLEPVSKICRRMLEHEDFFLAAQPEKPQVAILLDPENQIFSFAAGGDTGYYDQSLEGVYRSLYRAGYSVGFVHPRDFETGRHRQYGCIYLPLPYWISGVVAEGVEDFVREGGSLISEIWPAAYDSRENLHSLVTPGMGLAEVFGCREVRTSPQATTFSAYAMWDEARTTGSGLWMEAVADIGQVQAGTKIEVEMAMSFYEGKTEVLAVAPDGKPVVTRHAFGHGQAILAGAPLGLSAARQKEGGQMGRLVSGLVEIAIGKPAWQVPEGCRVDVLEHEGKRLAILENRNPEPAQVCLGVIREARGFLGDEPPAHQGVHGLEVEMPPDSVEAWWI